MERSVTLTEVLVVASIEIVMLSPGLAVSGNVKVKSKCVTVKFFETLAALPGTVVDKTMVSSTTEKIKIRWFEIITIPANLSLS